MADLKITQLPAIVGADVNNNDVFVLVDTSADITKKITRTELQNTIELGLLDNVNITGGSINGTTIGSSTRSTGAFTTLTASGEAYISQDLGIARAIPTAFWGAGNNASLHTGYGIFGSNGGFRLELIANGYRNSSGTWTTLNTNNSTSAASISLNTSDGNIVFGSDAAKASGTGITVTERMRITSAGAGGSGTTSPTAKLDVVGPAGITSFTGTPELGVVVKGSTGATDYSGIDFKGNNQTNPVARIAVLTTGGGSLLSFGTSNSYSSGITNTAMTIYHSGKVGIGTTAPLSLLHLASNAPYITFEDKDNNQDWQIQATAWFAIRDQSANLERMRVTSAGTVLVGTTTEYNDGSIGRGAFQIDGRSGTRTGITLRAKNSDGSAFVTSNVNVLGVVNGNGFIGGISANGSTTTYSTSSDYRLKENVDYTWDATTRLKQLKPARFNFISDGTNTLVDGFLAHEVSSIVPEAITGTKDAMTAQVLYTEGDELPDGKSVGDVKEPSVIKPQGIDQSKLIPLLVKTIQELESRITALEG